uniref:VRK serine/threonine kinase 3 n=1 Tax=Pelodiscus sinensis TaxID=13735 RepID=K7FYP1_PELSI
MVNFCPQCGQKVETAFHFCPVCGSRLPKEVGEGCESPSWPSCSAVWASRAIWLAAAGRRVPESQGLTGGAGQRDGSCQAGVPGWSLRCAGEQLHSASGALPCSEPCFCLLSKAKLSPRRLKSISVVPLPEGTILTDQSSKQWRLGTLLHQSTCGLIRVQRPPWAVLSPSRGQCWGGRAGLGGRHSKLGPAPGHFSPPLHVLLVEKWKKMHSVPLLGIPNCIGFGLHGSNYRFLVFPALGRSLQSILDDGANILTEKPVFQIAIRVLDALEYLHENEYVHGNVTAENIYVNPADLAEVTLVGYCLAFRYCPAGKHVAQREGSRTPHEGTIEFISLDGHRGAGPSRRSDLQSLGYCMVKWLCGSLPWTDAPADGGCLLGTRCVRGGAPGLSSGVCGFADALLSYLQRAMALAFEERPDYEALRQLLGKPLEMRGASAYDSVDLKVVP